MSKFDDRLGGYVEVKDRIALFLLQHPDGRLVTAKVKVTSEPDGIPRVWVKALAYRTPDDPHPGVGWSWMVLPGSTPYTKGSELENTETSAWGRAIGALGIGIDKSVASQDEVNAKAGEGERPVAPRLGLARMERSDDGSLIGTVAIAEKWLEDLQVRQTPEGPVIGFRLKQGRQSQKVQAHGPMALALGGLGTDLIGQTVTCWGRLTDQEFTPKGQTRPVPYQVFTLERVHGPTFDVPAVEMREVPDEAPDGAVGLTEAESESLWAELDAKKAEASA